MKQTPYVWLVLLVCLAGCGAQTPAAQAPTLEPVTAPTSAPTALPTSAPTTVPTLTPTTPTSSAAPQAQTTPVSATTVTIPMEGDIDLAGTLYGEGDIAVVLAHQMEGSQQQWKPFAADVAQQGFTALTFDFRGHGDSTGKRALGELDLDLKAVFTFLADRGITKIVCVGASMGGTACLKAAHEPNIVGLVVVSSPLVVQLPLSLGVKDFADLTYPKLFIVAEQDSELQSSVETMYKISPEPKQYKTFPGGAHGTALLGAATHDEFTKVLIDFLTQLR